MLIIFIMTKIINFTIILLVVFSSILFFGCSKEKPIIVDDTQATPDGINTIVDANNQFAFDVYSKLSENNENDAGNVFFSPYSISTALAMAYEGANGKTAEEMKEVLYFPEDNLVMKSSFAQLYNLLNKQDKEYKLSTANALWAQKDYVFLREYINTVEQYYGGKTTNLDFVNENAKSVKIINEWIEDQTNDRIKGMIPQLSPLTRLVLTNAIYFKGQWLHEFKKKNTKDMDFKITSDNIVTSSMMYYYDDKVSFNYAETNKMQILELPYKGEELSMIVFLPKENDMDVLETSLNVKKLGEFKSKLHKEDVIIYLPKFTFETKYSLPETLTSLGMKSAFVSQDADFSGMDGTKNLFIGDVIHQAFVEVNEEGTEAAAATAIVMEFKSAKQQEPKIFNADHPFMFIIQEKSTGTILFMGKVVEPTNG